MIAKAPYHRHAALQGGPRLTAYGGTFLETFVDILDRLVLFAVKVISEQTGDRWRQGVLSARGFGDPTVVGQFTQPGLAQPGQLGKPSRRNHGAV